MVGRCAIDSRAALAVVLLGVVVSGCGHGRVASSPSETAKPTPTASSSETAIGKRVSAAATAYLQARTQTLVRGVPAASLRDLCAPSSGLADYVLWWAAGTRLSSRGHAIGVPRQGYASASLIVDVKRVTIDPQAGTASVLAFTRPGPGDEGLVESSSAFHLVRLVRSENGGWLAEADTSTEFDPDLPTYLQAGGAPAAVVARARAEVLRAQHPGQPPAGCLTPLRAWCAAMNAHDATALKATYTRDSAIQAMNDAQVKAGFFAVTSPPNRRDWQIVKMKLLGIQIDGIACGWVTYSYMSDQPASDPGSRGYASFTFLERQADGHWLIFSPPG
jgi:hypothetical protein